MRVNVYKYINGEGFLKEHNTSIPFMEVSQGLVHSHIGVNQIEELIGNTDFFLLI